MAARVLGNIAPASESTSQTLTFSASTPGRAIVVAYVAPAVVTAPAGWVKTQATLSALESGFFVLPAAQHTVSLTSVTLTLSASRFIAAHVFEDDILNDVVTFTSANSAAPTGTTLSTPAETVSTSEAVALFGMTGLNGTSIGADALSYSSPFVEAGDVGRGSGTFEPARLWAARSTPANLSNQSVTATFSINLTGVNQSSFLISYASSGPSLGVAAVSPSDGATAVPTTSPVQVTFTSVPSTASISVTYPGGTVAGTTSGTGVTRTFTPSSALPSDTTFTVTVNASDAGGPMTPFTSTFDTNPPPSIVPPRVLRQYGGSAASSHSVSLTTPATPGLDVLMFCSAAATISTPSGWSQIAGQVLQDGKYVFRLDGANNPGITTVPTVTLNAARGMAAVVVEGRFEATATNDLLTGGPLGPVGNQWLTGARSIGDVDHQFAVFWSTFVDGAIGTMTSATQGFGVLGSGRHVANGPNQEGTAVSLAYRSGGTLSGQDVVGTLSSNTSTNFANGATAGLLTFAQRAPLPDTFPPTVLSINPSGAGASVTPTVVVTFSEDVQAGGVISLSGPSGSVTGTVSGSGSTRTFTPDAALAFGTTYTVSVSGWQDTSGNTQSGTATGTFTTLAAPDTTPPVVVTQSPAANGSDVSAQTSVSATFNEALGGSSWAMTVTAQGGAAVAGAVSYSPGSFTLLFTPSAPLAFSTTYDVSITGIVDASGNAAAPIAWSFTTAAQGTTGWGATLVDEIALPGAPSTDWSISGAGNVSVVAGFARQFSVNSGSTVDFSVHGAGCSTVDIYRIGGYDTGWRLVGSVSNTGTDQTANMGTIASAVVAGDDATQCDNWTVTASWPVPPSAWSGLYVAIPRDGTSRSWIPFVVRNDTRTPAIVVKTSETTWGAAYNYYGSPAAPLGGKSLYGSPGLGFPWDNPYRAFISSMNRPIVTREHVPQTYWLNAEAPLLRFLEKQGFDYKVISSADLDERGVGVLTGARVMISSGHDEYWSQAMRDACETWRDQGGHLIFMSGNEVFWRIEFSPDRSRVICYKDSIGSALVNPSGEWTGTWRDADWANVDPEYNLTGTYFRMNGVREFPLQVSAAVYGSLPFWRGTQVAAGQDLTVNDIIGFEADDARPTLPAAVLAANSSISLPSGVYATDDGVTYTSGVMNWGIQIQQADSLGVVVGFGTCQWSWGLDPVHDRLGNVENAAVKQATINLLTDMGAVARRPQTGLVAPAAVGWADYGLIGGGETGGGGVVVTPPTGGSGNSLYISDGTRWIRVV